LSVTWAKVKKGIFNWRKEKPESFSLKKVIVTDTGKLSPWYDEGTCGVDAGGYCIVDSKEEGEKLVEFLNSPLVEFIAKQFTNKGQLRYPVYLFCDIPKDIINGDWKNIFDLTEEEMKILC
jgi:hypothetical protein